jgi:hypothetical protein
MSTLLTGSNPHPTPHRNPPLAGDYLARLARRCLLIVPNAWSFGYPKPQRPRNQLGISTSKPKRSIS